MLTDNFIDYNKKFSCTDSEKNIIQYVFSNNFMKIKNTWSHNNNTDNF